MRHQLLLVEVLTHLRLQQSSQLPLIKLSLRELGFWIFLQIASVLESVKGVLSLWFTVSLPRLSLKVLLIQVEELVWSHLEVWLVLGVVASSISLWEVVLKELLTIKLSLEDKDLLVLLA